MPNFSRIKSKSKSTINAWLVSAVIIIITLFFVYYFLIYVAKQEQLYTAEGFRVLTKIGENLNNRDKSYTNLLDNLEILKPDKNDPTKMNLNLDYLYSPKELKQQRAFSINYLNKRISKLTFGLELERNKANKKDSYRLSEFKPTKIIGEKFKNKPDSPKLALSIPTKTFFEPLERKDIFNEFIVWEDTLYPKILYQSFRGDIESHSLKFKLTGTENILSGRTLAVKINDIDYKLFLSQVILHNNKHLYLGGLIETGNFMEKVRNIDPLFATSLVIFFLILLAMLPILKLKLLNEYSDLKLTDLTFSIMGLFLLSFLSILVINLSYQHASTDKQLTRSLYALSDSISNNFSNEMLSMRKSLVNLMTNDEIKELKANHSAKSDEKIEDKTYSRIAATLNYKYYKTLYTMDTTGQQIWVSSNRLGPHIKSDLYYRNYFKQSGEWELAPGKKVMIESIKSNTSGETLGVLSICDGNFVHAVTSRLYSVINTILPDGYSFYIVTKTGDIWFSSEESKILQENLFEETQHSNDLREAIYRNEKTDFAVRYHGKKHSAVTRQISTLPLNIVVLYDISRINSSSMIVISFTSFLILLTIIILIISILLARLTKYKHVFLRRPIKHLETIIPDFANHDFYVLSALFNVIASIVITLFSFIYESCFGFIIQAIITSLIFIALLRKGSTRLAIYLYSGLLVIFVLIISLNDHNIVENIVFQIVLIFIGLTLFYAPLKLIKYDSTKVNKDLKAYHAYVFSWILILVFLPTIIFFVKSYNHEAKLDAGNRLYKYALDKSGKDYEIDRFTEEYCTSSTRSSFRKLKNEGNYFTPFNKIVQDSCCTEENESPLFSDLFAQFSDRIRPGEFSKYYFSSIKDSNDSLKTCDDGDTWYLRYRIPQQYYLSGKSRNNLTIKTTYEKFAELIFYDPLISYLFIITSLVGIFLIYFITKFLIAKYFGTEFFEEKQLEGMKTGFDDFVKNHIKARLNLIIEKPYAERKIDYGNHVQKIDTTGLMIEAASEEESKEKYFLYNLNLAVNDAENDLKILSAICSIVKKEKSRIALDCPVSFEKFVDDYLDLVNSIKNDKQDKSNNKEKKELYENILNKLEDINYTFVHLIPPLLDDSYKKCCNESNCKTEIHKFTENEIKFLPHCKNILPVVAEYVDKLINNPKKRAYQEEIILEKIVRKIYKLSSQFYSMLLSSCSKKEILLLHDIADDALINDQRKSILAVLLKKGLIEYRGHYRIMNESFRNFILTKFESETGQEYLENQRVTGKWHVYRLPVILILVALAFFLAFQESIMSNLTTILTSIVAAMGIIGKFSGLFSSTGNMLPKNNP